jgi:ABC-type multidrug transport system ATPase subunit
VAAGVEAPDSGSVFYDGQELSSHPQLIGEAIAFCRRCPRSGELHSSVLEMLLYPQLARGTDLLSARARAHAALERTGANEHAMLAPGELEAGERTRVALAAALTLRPSLIVIDEPLMGVDPLERDPILALMRTLADDGTSILMSTGEAACLAGADRALTLSHGQLHGQATPQHAQLIPLYPRGHRAA